MEKQIMSSYYLRSMKTRSEEFSKFHKKTPELVSSFIKRRHCRCVLVNLENFDRPSFSKNTSGQLLLCCTLWECTVSSLSSKIIVPVNFFINSKMSTIPLALMLFTHFRFCACLWPVLICLGKNSPVGFDIF